jgi:pimeloyl-ACP methyl ester carboxylesterase
MPGKSRLRTVILLVLVVGALAWALFGRRSATTPVPLTAAAPDVMRLGRMQLEPCTIGRADTGLATLRAYCAAVLVPENRQAPGGRRLSLKVAVVGSEAAQAASDLVVFLDGGPGGAATQDYPALAGAFGPLRKNHAVLLIDQRGTGGSGPLACGDDVSTDAAPDLEQLRECVRRLAPRAAPEFYTTSDAVEDLEAVRRMLGSPPLDLIGVSYGTRVAQQYARKYGASVRAVVLDGAVPNSLAIGSDHAGNLETVLRAIFARCRASAACAGRYGDPYQTLRRVQARLRAQPQKLSLRDPYTFRVQEKLLTADSLAQLVRIYAYSPYTAALLPYVLQQADNGDYAPLMAQAQVVVGDVADALSAGMALSVSCAEDADRLQLSAADADTVLGNSLISGLLAACPLWPHGTRPKDFGEPLRGPLPVLVLAGQYDPVTPARYGEAIVGTLPRARLLQLKGQGHGLLLAGCVPRLLDEFIRTLDAQALDAHCLEVLAQTPPFVDANGAGP